MTRSARSARPPEWTEVGLPVKLVKLLVADMQHQIFEEEDEEEEEEHSQEVSSFTTITSMPVVLIWGNITIWRSLFISN